MRYRSHLIYWTIIAGLAAWLVWEKTAHKHLNLHRASTQTLKMAGDLLARNNQSLLMEIQRSVAEYPSEEGVAWKTRAETLDHLCAETTDQVLRLSEQVHNKNIHPKALKTNLLQLTRAYRDSFLLLTYNDPDLSRSLPDLLLDGYEISPQWLVPFLEKAHPEELQLILQNIITRIKSAHMAGLNFVASKSTGHTIVCNFGPIIGLSPVNAAPRVGDWYSAEVFAQMYERPKARNMRILVNGEELTIQDGVAEFKHRYTTPGVKKLHAEMIFTHPLTKESRRFQKEFSVTVVDTCRVSK